MTGLIDVDRFLYIYIFIIIYIYTYTFAYVYILIFIFIFIFIYTIYRLLERPAKPLDGTCIYIYIVDPLICIYPEFMSPATAACSV